MLTEKDINDMKEVSPEQNPIKRDSDNYFIALYDQFVEFFNNHIAAFQFWNRNKDAYKQSK